MWERKRKGGIFTPQGTKNHSDAYKGVMDFYGEGRKQYHLTGVIMLLMSRSEPTYESKIVEQECRVVCSEKVMLQS